MHCMVHCHILSFNGHTVLKQNIYIWKLKEHLTCICIFLSASHIYIYLICIYIYMYVTCDDCDNTFSYKSWSLKTLQAASNIGLVLLYLRQYHLPPSFISLCCGLSPPLLRCLIIIAFFFLHDIYGDWLMDALSVWYAKGNWERNIIWNCYF